MGEVPLYAPPPRLWLCLSRTWSFRSLRSFRSFGFFDLPTEADTGTCSVERPCFLSWRSGMHTVQGYLAYKNPPPLRTLQ